MRFNEWRERAREYLKAGVTPQDAHWGDPPPLFDTVVTRERSRLEGSASVPKEFLQIASTVACHRDGNRWTLLYRILWRLTLGAEHNLLLIEVDDDIRKLRLLERAVRRDMHKMKAFVRFRRVKDSEPEQFVAWHRPDHDIVQAMAPWFAERFGNMRWSILTPWASAHWNTKELSVGPGALQSTGYEGDALEDLWRNYYASIFNPARVKVKTMKAGMPVRYWATLPETGLIPALLANAPQQVEDMERKQKTSAAKFVPQSNDLKQLSRAAAACQGCELFRHATQTVFGEGAPNARVVLVGEQPGDEEDRKGHPFVGPAGRLLDKALQEAGVNRSILYVTNAVKHFKFEPRGKRRIHKKPSGPEISACRPWLEAEMAAIRPDLIVCLGATAARSVYGREVKVTRERGELQPHHWAQASLITVHPSALLRIEEEDRKKAEWELFVRDLSQIRTWFEEHNKAE
jgi:DNA polymerase